MRAGGVLVVLVGGLHVGEVLEGAVDGPGARRYLCGRGRDEWFAGEQVLLLLFFLVGSVTPDKGSLSCEETYLEIQIIQSPSHVFGSNILVANFQRSKGVKCRIIEIPFLGKVDSELLALCSAVDNTVNK